MNKLEVSNLNYSCFLHYCDKNNIVPDFLVEGTNLSISQLRNIKERTTWDDWNIILGNFSHVPESDRDEICKYAAIGEDYNTVVPLVFGYFSPQIPYWILTKFLGKRLYKNVDFSLREVSSNEIIMTISVKSENEVHPLFFENYIYVYKYLSLLTTNKESKVHMSKREKNSAEYTVLLPKRLPLFKRFLQLVHVFSGHRSSMALIIDLNKTNDQLENLTNELYISNEIKKNLLAEVELKNEELNKLYAQKTTLIRMLVHDVSTPIMIASLNLKALRRLDEDKEVSKEKLNKYNSISAGLDSVTTFISEARSLEDITSHGKTYKLEKVDVDQSINYAIELAQAKIPGKKVKIVYNSNLEIGTCVCADYQKFSNSVLANIISNSIKFSYEGDCIEVESLIDFKNMVVITVKDRGIGIPIHIQNDIFKLEKKTSRLGTNGEKGTGYGMPIVKAVIDTLGGEIEIESYDINTNPLNHGTTLTLRLMAMDESFTSHNNSNASEFLNIK